MKPEQITPDTDYTTLYLLRSRGTPEQQKAATAAIVRKSAAERAPATTASTTIEKATVSVDMHDLIKSAQIITGNKADVATMTQEEMKALLEAALTQTTQAVEKSLITTAENTSDSRVRSMCVEKLVKARMAASK